MACLLPSGLVSCEHAVQTHPLALGVTPPTTAVTQYAETVVERHARSSGEPSPSIVDRLRYRIKRVRSSGHSLSNYPVDPLGMFNKPNPMPFGQRLTRLKQLHGLRPSAAPGIHDITPMLAPTQSLTAPTDLLIVQNYGRGAETVAVGAMARMSFGRSTTPYPCIRTQRRSDDARRALRLRDLQVMFNGRPRPDGRIRDARDAEGEVMGKRRSDADSRRFFDEFEKVRVSRFRAIGRDRSGQEPSPDPIPRRQDQAHRHCATRASPMAAAGQLFRLPEMRQARSPALPDRRCAAVHSMLRCNEHQARQQVRLRQRSAQESQGQGSRPADRQARNQGAAQVQASAKLMARQSATGLPKPAPA